MWRISNLFYLLVIFSTINMNFSAVHFNTRSRKARILEYKLIKTANTYRGLLFTLSASEKNEICQEAFSVQLYAAHELENPKQDFTLKSLINDGLNTDGDPQYPLIVRKLDRTYAEFAYPSNVMEIFFRCVGKSFVEREPIDFADYHISFGFRSGWFYANALNDDKKDGLTYMEQINFFMKSPQYVELKPNQLEDQYASIRQIMRALEKESPRYVAMIDGRNDLLPLSKFKRDLLCASILSSPIYRKDRLEFSLDLYQKNIEILNYDKRELKFRNNIYDKEKFNADCFICNAYADQDDKKKGPQKLFLTSAYKDNHSIYVLKQEAKGIFLSKYFTQIPLLKNTRVYTPDGFIYKNYNAYEKVKPKKK